MPDADSTVYGDVTQRGLEIDELPERPDDAQLVILENREPCGAG